MAYGTDPIIQKGLAFDALVPRPCSSQLGPCELKKVHEALPGGALIVYDGWLTTIGGPEGPTVTVDNIEVAQFIYLLLHNEKIRDVVDTIGKKGVLLRRERLSSTPP